MPPKCEAKVVMSPDTLLSDHGYKTSISCQKCEIPISEVLIRAKDPDLLRDAEKFVQYFLQKCPKLVEAGFIPGQIPEDLLPKVEQK